MCGHETTHTLCVILKRLFSRDSNTLKFGRVLLSNCTKLMWLLKIVLQIFWATSLALTLMLLVISITSSLMGIL